MPQDRRPSEPTYAQRRHMEAIDRAAADLIGVVRKALAGDKPGADGVAAAVGLAVTNATTLLLAT